MIRNSCQEMAHSTYSWKYSIYTRQMTNGNSSVIAKFYKKCNFDNLKDKLKFPQFLFGIWYVVELFGNLLFLRLQRQGFRNEKFKNILMKYLICL